MKSFLRCCWLVLLLLAVASPPLHGKVLKTIKGKTTDVATRWLPKIGSSAVAMSLMAMLSVAPLTGVAESRYKEVFEKAAKETNLQLKDEIEALYPYADVVVNADGEIVNQGIDWGEIYRIYEQIGVPAEIISLIKAKQAGTIVGGGDENGRPPRPIIVSTDQATEGDSTRPPRLIADQVEQAVSSPAASLAPDVSLGIQRSLIDLARLELYQAVGVLDDDGGFVGSELGEIVHRYQRIRESVDLTAQERLFINQSQLVVSITSVNAAEAKYRGEKPLPEKIKKMKDWQTTAYFAGYVKLLDLSWQFAIGHIDAHKFLSKKGQIVHSAREVADDLRRRKIRVALGTSRISRVLH